MIRKIALFAGLLGVLIMIGAGGASAQKGIDKIKYPPLSKQEIPPIDKTSLDNGITLYLMEDHDLPIIKAAVRFGAGEYLSPSEKVGLAATTGAVMRTGGTEKMTGDQIDEALEAIGASIEVNIGKTSGSARMNILSEYADTGLAILSDIIRRPIFDPDKIDLAKTSERSEISRRNDEAISICVREFTKQVYGEASPYGRHTEYATINAITRNDLKAFHRQYITPENTMIAVWGDFNKDEMKAKITRLFGDWPKGSGKVPRLPEVDYQFEPGVYYAPKDNVNQSSVLLGHIGGFMSDPDYYAMIVMNNILGGSFSSRMFNNIRTRLGLAYSVYGNYISNIGYPGIYYNVCLTKSESTVKAVKAMIEEIKKMQAVAPSTEEMRLGKDGYLNSFVFNFEDKGDIINRIMEYDYYGFPSDFIYKVKDNIEKVTSQDVLEVARKRLHPEALKIVVVGKGADFDEPLSALGEVDTLDISIPSGESKAAAAATPESIARGKELLALALKACGGKEKFARIKAASSKGTMTLSLPQGDMALKTSNIFVLPDKSRETISTPMGDMISVNSGDKGWVMRGGQVIDAPAEQVAETQEEYFRNTLLLFQNLDQPVYQPSFLETGTFDGKAVNIVQISSADGSTSFKLALDAKTNLPVAKIYFGQTMTGPGNLAEVFSDYRDISGVKIAFTTRIDSDGKKIGEISLTEYLINPDVPEGTFDKPK